MNIRCVRMAVVSLLGLVLSAGAQAPTVTNVSLAGSGNLWPAFSTNVSPCFNTCFAFFDQGVTGVTSQVGGLYHEDGTLLTSFRISTTTFATNKQFSFTNLLLTAREETNFYLQPVTGMAVNANGAWDGVFNLPGLVTNRLHIVVNAAYWTNTLASDGVITNPANYLNQVTPNGETGLGFMRDGAYGLSNFPATLTRKVFSMDASNAVVQFDIGTGKSLVFNSQAGDPSGRPVISWSAGKTNVLEVPSGTLDVRLGMVVGEFGSGRLLVQGTNSAFRQGMGAGDTLFLGLSPGSRGEVTLSNAAISYVRAAVVGSLGTGRLVVDQTVLSVTNLITVAEKSGSVGSEVAVTNGGALLVAGLGDINVGLATGTTGATLRITGSGSRMQFANSASASRSLIISQAGTVGSQVLIENGGTAYLGGGDSPSGSVFVSKGGTGNGGSTLLQVDGAGSSMTARTVRVSVSTAANMSGGSSHTQRFVVANGAYASILSDLVLGGSLPSPSSGNQSLNSLADINGGTLVVGSNLLFASRLISGMSSVFSNHQMMVRGGGAVSATAVSMGDFSNSTITRLTVTGASSRVDVSGLFKLGNDGRSNVVRVVDGGQLSASQMTLGYGLATNNVLVVDGANSAATVSITNAAGTGLLTVTRGLVQISSGGVLRVDQLIATNSEGTLTVAAGGRLLLTSANLSEFGAAGLTVGAGAELGGLGTVKETATIQGFLSPGLSAGTLSFDNDLNLAPGSVCRFELGPPATSDQVVVGSVLDLTGLVWSNFEFTALSGFTNGTYVLIDAAGLTGALGASTTGTVNGLAAALSVDVNNDLLLTVSGGGGGSAVLGVSPASFAYGAVEVGLYSNAIFVVTNSGSAQLDGTATVAGVGFSVESGSPFSVAAGSSASVEVRFTPVLAEDYSGEVIFLSNGGGATNALTGQGFVVAGSTNRTFSLVAGQPTLSFGLVSGALYRVQATTNLLSDVSWQDVTDPRTNRSGASVSFVDTNSPPLPQRAYRVLSP